MSEIVGAAKLGLDCKNKAQKGRRITRTSHDHRVIEFRRNILLLRLHYNILTIFIFILRFKGYMIYQIIEFYMLFLFKKSQKKGKNILSSEKILKILEKTFMLSAKLYEFN